MRAPDKQLKDVYFCCGISTRVCQLLLHKVHTIFPLRQNCEPQKLRPACCSTPTPPPSIRGTAYSTLCPVLCDLLSDVTYTTRLSVFRYYFIDYQSLPTSATDYTTMTVCCQSQNSLKFLLQWQSWSLRDHSELFEVYYFLNVFELQTKFFEFHNKAASVCQHNGDMASSLLVQQRVGPCSTVLVHRSISERHGQRINAVSDKGLSSVHY